MSKYLHQPKYICLLYYSSRRIRCTSWNGRLVICISNNLRWYRTFHCIYQKLLRHESSKKPRKCCTSKTSSTTTTGSTNVQQSIKQRPQRCGFLFKKKDTNKKKKLSPKRSFFIVVEIKRFELLTPCLQGRCSSQLSYTPICSKILTHFVFFVNKITKKRLAKILPTKKDIRKYLFICFLLEIL